MRAEGMREVKVYEELEDVREEDGVDEAGSRKGAMSA